MTQKARHAVGDATPPTRGGLAAQSAAIKRQLRIMVVENDALIGMLLAELLEEMGHAVCAIEETADGAVSSAASRHPDLMIVDVSLGESSGISVVDTIERGGKMPHVFVSGDVARVKMLRPNSIVVQKPYREAEIANAIRRATDHRRSV